MSWSRMRLAVLVSILAGLWVYAVATDHGAPAWGASQLPDLLNTTVVLVGMAAVVAAVVRAWSARHGRK